MRRSLPRFAPLVLLALLVPASPAFAQKDADITGTYEVKYDEVANNCTHTGIALGRGTLEVQKKGKTLQVDIQRFPIMTGTQGKAGKLRAASKIGSSPIQGADVKVSTAGRVLDGVISLVFVAEFYVDKKPLCTQSWNIEGVRKEQLDKAAQAPVAAPPELVQVVALAPVF
jgi:hypothetical protein